MGRRNLQETAFKKLELKLSRCSIYEGTVTANSDTCSKIYVPTDWTGKKVFVVLYNG